MIKTAGLMKKNLRPFLIYCEIVLLQYFRIPAQITKPRLRDDLVFANACDCCVCVYYKIFHYKVQFRRLQTSTNMLLYTIIIKENSLTQ